MIRRELSRFLLAGFTAAGIDYLAYRGLVWVLGGGVDVAKAFGFLCGTCFSYLASKYWTFGHKKHPKGSLKRFLPVYLLSLGINVGVNGALLGVLEGVFGAITLSFIVASGLSAAFNFLALKFFVFTGRAG